VLVQIQRITSPKNQDKIDSSNDLFSNSAPVTPQLHLFSTELGQYLLVSSGSRIYRLDEEVHRKLLSVVDSGDSELVDDFVHSLGVSKHPFVTDEPPLAPPIRALSLAVAQKCNLGCTYCYAQGGDFGNEPSSMSLEVALATIELLFSEAQENERVNVSFLGGEPLTNRAVLQKATERAAQIGRTKGVSVNFSITTNATLLTPGDGEFFEQYAFAVTVSLDGIGEIHDRLRPYKSGKGSYHRVISNTLPLIEMQERMQVSARVTITPRNLHLRETLEELIGLGFHSVGFSPMLSSPTGRDQMNGADMSLMLEQLVDCGEEFERRILKRQRYPFMNMTNAMREIHRGTHRPYPCGAGAGYMGVSAQGSLYPCHRFVDDTSVRMGDVVNGIDRQRQGQWLAQRHVHQQEPCKSCWARYMCGGGCHHEVINRGRPACDYIRGWLHYCLQAYTRLLERVPEYFHA
jgi:uncharacterized protein